MPKIFLKKELKDVQITSLSSYYEYENFGDNAIVIMLSTLNLKLSEILTFFIYAVEHS